MKKLTYQEVSDYFKSQGCTLLSKDYRNNSTKLEYLCSCGNPAPDFKRFYHFKNRGQRCPLCKLAKKKQTNRLKYGEENYNNIDKMRQTKLKKYGQEYYTNPAQAQQTKFERHQQGYYIGGGHSKESQTLFWKLYDKLVSGAQLHCYFAELNREYGMRSLDGTFHLYDFVITGDINKCIEYNGSAFHPPPNLSEDATGWFPYDKSLTAGEKRSQDFQKINTLKKLRSIDTLVVWDYETDKTEKCLKFLLG